MINGAACPLLEVEHYIGFGTNVSKTVFTF
jgi:hypothetical protein